ncbi:hypothetical protein [Phaffia rhodozyma]|uniref:Uncharacterized protein n=1 Tax=Phaffia rhodozyma TaxID=264483 RepID=A0A0F7SQB3_PHARH|nr:hypothetical protein [Phaffia rhodozyma]
MGRLGSKVGIRAWISIGSAGRDVCSGVGGVVDGGNIDDDDDDDDDVDDVLGNAIFGRDPLNGDVLNDDMLDGNALDVNPDTELVRMGEVVVDTDGITFWRSSCDALSSLLSL